MPPVVNTSAARAAARRISASTADKSSGDHARRDDVEAVVGEGGGYGWAAEVLRLTRGNTVADGDDRAGVAHGERLAPGKREDPVHEGPGRLWVREG